MYFPPGHNPSLLTPENCNAYSLVPGFTQQLSAQSTSALSDTAFTIEGWIYPTNLEYEERFIVSRGTTNYGYAVGIFNQNLFFKYGTGTSVASFTDATALTNVAYPYQIGGQEDTVSFTGLMDNFRITRAARYTSAFTPPTRG